MISVEDVAAVTADALEMSDAPLRLPIGDLAVGVLAARVAHDPATPFQSVPVSW